MTQRCRPRKRGWWQAPPRLHRHLLLLRHQRLRPERKKAPVVHQQLASTPADRAAGRDRCGHPGHGAGHTAAGSDSRCSRPGHRDCRDCHSGRRGRCAGHSGGLLNDTGRCVRRIHGICQPQESSTPAADPAPAQMVASTTPAAPPAPPATKPKPAQEGRGSPRQLKNSAKKSTFSPFGERCWNVHLKRKAHPSEVRLLIYIGAWRRWWPCSAQSRARRTG